MHARPGCQPMQQGGQVDFHTALQHQVDKAWIIDKKRVVVAHLEPLPADAVQQVIVEEVSLGRSIRRHVVHLSARALSASSRRR